MTDEDKKEKPAKPKKRRRDVGGPRFLMGLFVVVALFTMLIGIAAPGPLMMERTIVIPRGTGVQAIGNMLESNGAIYNAILFRIAARLGAHDQLKAGEYQLMPQQSTADIIDMMHVGQSITHVFTVAEGLTVHDVVALMKATPMLTGDVTPLPEEGSLLPETYKYTFGDSRQSLIARMQKGEQEALAEAWSKRDGNIPLKTPEEAVVMASIVEKETGKPEERPRIAGVFYNRLQKSMRLQSDPTVIYAITKDHGLMDHDLNHEDLAYSSPYNTYASDGLPPHPICNPGRASIEAALHPEVNDFLFFVADGTGGHTFSNTMQGQNKNVAAWVKETKAKEKEKKKEEAKAKKAAAAKPKPKPAAKPGDINDENLGKN